MKKLNEPEPNVNFTDAEGWLVDQMLLAREPISPLPRRETIHLRAAHESEPEGIEGAGETCDEI